MKMALRVTEPKRVRNVTSRRGVIPGEQRETRNPGDIISRPRRMLLNAGFRWHDEIVSA
jgi:hypothetical protein